MSTALAVCHGSFGRVTVYRLDKPMRTHAHREGHLTFLLSGPPAIITIEDIPHLVDQSAGVAINPWQPHSFQPCSGDQPSVFLVAYICESWLDRDQEGRGSLRFRRQPAIRVGTTIRSICASLGPHAGDERQLSHRQSLFESVVRREFRRVVESRKPAEPGDATAARRSTFACASRCAFWMTAHRRHRTRRCRARRRPVAAAFLQAVS